MPRQDPCRAPARLLPKTSAGPQPGPHLPRLHCRSHAAASPPARHAPAWRRAASRPTRQAPARWHADLSEDQKHVRSGENQKTTILCKILAEDTHETPGKILVGDDHNATGRPLPGPRQGPCRGHPQGHSQAHARQGSTTAPMQLPAHQLGRHLRVNRRHLGQLSDAYVVACKSS